MHSAVLKVAMALTGVALLGGCAGIRDHRGYVFDEQLASGIQVGVDNKDSVARTLGRPTFTGQFTPNDWYYVGRDTSTFAFRRPRVTESTALGAGFLAGLAVGYWDSTDAAADAWSLDQEFTPGMGMDERARRCRRWREAVERAKGWERG